MHQRGGREAITDLEKCGAWDQHLEGKRMIMEGMREKTKARPAATHSKTKVLEANQKLL